MPAGKRPSLLEAFGLGDRRYVHLIGGGGKTSLMFALAGALATTGRSVLTTTSTRIAAPEVADSERVVIGTDAASLVERLRSEFASRRHVTAAGSRVDEGRKLGGLPVAVLDELAGSHVADIVLVEADGSAGRSLKAHLPHEPVVSPRADLAIAVIGVDCLGQPIDDAHVHRADLFRERLGRPPGAAVTPEDAAGIVFHREGYLARVPGNCGVIVFINKAGTPEQLGRARLLRETLGRMDHARRVERVVIGDSRTGVFEQR